MPSTQTFAQFDLNPQIFKALTECGYTKPTPIQTRSIPEILKGKDIVASAQTGTGKTAAFILPALHKLTTTAPCRKPRVLVLSPTRELASQITKAANKYGKFLRFNTVSLVGGMPYREQLRDLSKPVDIVVATPGRLLDHLQNKRLDLSQLEMLILDEADRMLDMGFIDDIKTIAKLIPKKCQILLFSATVDSKLTKIINQLLKEPLHIDLSEEKMAPAKITQILYMADNVQHKNRLLQHFFDNENIFKAIIFCATKIDTENLANDLKEQGYIAGALHGDLKQNVRTRMVEQLRRGRIQYLVATDVAARGIDIHDITHVFNYDIPRFSEDYVHRIGRTGRAGKTGTAISFATYQDIRHVDRIERYVGEKLSRAIIPGLEPTRPQRGAKPEGQKPKKKGFKPRNDKNPRWRSGNNNNSKTATAKKPGAKPNFARKKPRSKTT